MEWSCDGGTVAVMKQRAGVTTKTVKQRGRWRRRRAALWWRFSYLALAIVPPRPLVTQTNKTARTYHRGAVSDLGLDTAVFFKLYEVVERIPRPRAEEEERIKKHGMRKLEKKATTNRDRQKKQHMGEKKLRLLQEETSFGLHSANHLIL